MKFDNIMFPTLPKDVSQVLYHMTITFEACLIFLITKLFIQFRMAMVTQDLRSLLMSISWEWKQFIVLTLLYLLSH